MKWRITALLVLVAFPGVVATAWLALPLLVDAARIPVSLETLQIASAVQGTVLLVAAAFIGASLAPSVGLAAPAMSAIASGRRGLDSLRAQLLPGVLGGCIGAAVIVGFYAFAPESLGSVQPETPLPLVVRVLYGGVTEEVLVRWGLMTSMAWAGWKILRRDLPHPSAGIMWVAIALSAFAFGVSHLPSAAQSLPALSAYGMAYITIGNALFGLVAGYLFWRHGLEAAIVAHASAHVLAFIVRG